MQLSQILQEISPGSDNGLGKVRESQLPWGLAQQKLAQHAEHHRLVQNGPSQGPRPLKSRAETTGPTQTWAPVGLSSLLPHSPPPS